MKEIIKLEVVIDSRGEFISDEYNCFLNVNNFFTSRKGNVQLVQVFNYEDRKDIEDYGVCFIKDGLRDNITLINSLDIKSRVLFEYMIESLNEKYN